jgi:hypothetical protein
VIYIFVPLPLEVKLKVVESTLQHIEDHNFRFSQLERYVEFLNTRLTVVNNQDLKKINQAQIAKQNYGTARFSIGNVLSLPPNHRHPQVPPPSRA